MSNIDIDIDRLAHALFQAFETGEPIAPLSEQMPGLDAASAYKVQRVLIQLHTAAGRRVVARKVGLTSKAMQQQMGVDQPDYGVIFDRTTFENGAALSRSAQRMIQPRIEAEIAFILSRELRGPGVTTIDVLAASSAVLPVFEIIDCRLANWRIKLIDTIADNASGWGLVLGSTLSLPYGMDLATVGMVLERDGEVLATGAGAAVLDHPARAIAWLANTLAAYDEGLPTGEPILSGALTASMEAISGHYRARFGDGLGSVELVMKD